jgi:hypothetical protein
MDGTRYFSSPTIHCPSCSVRQHRNRTVTYSHTAITPVIVASGNPKVIPLEPEFITPQDGHDKQDCENAADSHPLSALTEANPGTTSVKKQLLNAAGAFQETRCWATSRIAGCSRSMRPHPTTRIARGILTQAIQPAQFCIIIKQVGHCHSPVPGSANMPGYRVEGGSGMRVMRQIRAGWYRHDISGNSRLIGGAVFVMIVLLY